MTALQKLAMGLVVAVVDPRFAGFDGVPAASAVVATVLVWPRLTEELDAAAGSRCRDGPSWC